MTDCYEPASVSHLLQTDQDKPTTENTQPDDQQSDLPKNSLKGYSTKMFPRKGKKVINKEKVENLHQFKYKLGLKSALENIRAGQGANDTCSEEVCNEFTCNVSLFHPHNDDMKKKTKYCFKKLEDGTFSMENIADEMPPEELSKKDAVNERKSKSIISRGGRYARKPLKICFKKRSKTLKSTLKLEDECDAGDSTLKQVSALHLENKEQPETNINSTDRNVEGLQKCQSSGGTWTTFKSLVNPRKKTLSSSKMQAHFESKNPKDAKAGNTRLQSISKPHSHSKLKIPCIRLTRSKRKSGHLVLADEEYCTTLTHSLEANRNGLEYAQHDKAATITSNLGRSLVTAALEKGSDPLKCLQSILMRSDAEQQPESTAEPEILTPEAADGLINEEQIHRLQSKDPGHTTDPKGKAEFCQSTKAQESQENILSLNKEQNTKETKNKVLLQDSDLENHKRIVSITKESEAECTALLFNLSICQDELPDSQYFPCNQSMAENKEDLNEKESSRTRKLLCPEESNENCYGHSHNGISVISVHTDGLQISGTGPWREDTMCSDGSLSDTNLNCTFSAMSSQYEVLLVETASSLVKAVLQSSIEQLIDERTFDNHPQNTILQM